MFNFCGLIGTRTIGLRGHKPPVLETVAQVPVSRGRSTGGAPPIIKFFCRWVGEARWAPTPPPTHPRRDGYEAAGALSLAVSFTRNV